MKNLFNIILTIVVLGFVCPFLVSAQDSLLVIFGVLLVGANVFYLYKQYKEKIMKILKGLFVVMIFGMLANCSTVPAGNVGIKVYLLGGSKGVDQEVLGVGRYWIGMNEQLYIFPTFQQNYTWTRDPIEGDTTDESITFQTSEGLEVNTDVGISYHLEADKIPLIFQKYRKGVDEITDIYLRNSVRDAMNSVAAKMGVEDVYGQGKSEFLSKVQEIVSKQNSDIGIIIDKLYIVGSFRLPQNVVAALNLKIEATQKAQQRENEVKEAEAEAKKQIAKADGEAKSILLKAEAEAEANKKVGQSITENLIKYEQIKKWNGSLPQVQGNAGTLIDLK